MKESRLKGPIAAWLFFIAASAILPTSTAQALATSFSPWIYFADNGNRTVNRIRWDGAGFEILAQTDVALLGITIDQTAKKLYWSDNPQLGLARLHRSDLNGANQEVAYEAVLPNQGETVGQLAIDEAARYLYWIDEGQDRIRRMNLAGPGPVIDVLPSGATLGTALEVDAAAGKIYFGSGDFGNASSKIERINLNGSGRELVANAYAYSIFVDAQANRILGGDIQDRFVFEVPLDTHVRHNLFSVLTPRDVQRFGDQLLFSQVSTTSATGESGLFSRIVRSDLDGSNRFIVREVNRAIDPADHIAYFVYVPEPDALGLALIGVVARGIRRKREPQSFRNAH